MKPSFIFLVGFIFLASFICADEEPVFVDSVTVEHIEGHTYNITVSGNLPNPGYSNVRLVPHTYMMAPESWEIVVLADAPSGDSFMIQVIQPYTVSLEYTFSADTKSITIISRTGNIEKPLSAPEEPQQEKHLETIYGVKVKNDSLVFSVVTNGCTKKEHFVVDVNTDGDTTTITLYRTQLDYCEMAPALMKVSFSLKKLGLDRSSEFYIGNRFAIMK